VRFWPSRHSDKRRAGNSILSGSKSARALGAVSVSCRVSKRVEGSVASYLLRTPSSPGLFQATGVDLAFERSGAASRFERTRERITRHHLPRIHAIVTDAVTCPGFTRPIAWPISRVRVEVEKWRAASQDIHSNSTSYLLAVAHARQTGVELAHPIRQVPFRLGRIVPRARPNNEIPKNSAARRSGPTGIPSAFARKSMYRPNTAVRPVISSGRGGEPDIHEPRSE
jgi:hypothetical protein